MDAWRSRARFIPGGMAPPRPGRGPRAQHTARAAGDGGRPAGGPAADHGSLHHCHLPRDGLINEAKAFVDGLAAGDAVGAAVAIGLVSLVLILVLQRWLPRIPGVLVAVVVAIGAASAFNLADHGVSLVGTLPEGFPSPSWPNPVSDLPLLVAGALGIALVSLT